MKNGSRSPLSDLIEKSGLTYRLAESLSKVIHQSFSVNLKPEEILFEHPKNPSFGDYSTNIAMVLSTNIKYQISNINPNAIAKQLASEWQKDLLKEIEKVEVIGGFLNIWLNNEHLISQMEEVLEDNEEFGKNNLLKGKKILLEHTSPNPQTTIMLGHLRNNFLGMTSANLMENAGAKVILDCIVNDRGVHICRSMWGYLVFAKKIGGLTKKELINFRQVNINTNTLGLVATQGQALRELIWRDLLNQWINTPKKWWTPEELGIKPDHANLIWYVLGSRAYKEIDGIEKQVSEILSSWEADEQKVRKLWQTIISWSEEGYAQTYQRIGSRHDKYWYESDHWQQGKDIVEEGLKHDVFKLGNPDPKNGKQPIVTNLASDGLPDTVVIKSDDTGLYMTQDLALTKLKIKEFPSDYYIWDIGLEQAMYLQQLFTVIDKLGIVKKEQLFHLSYALINFKGRTKMSTRSGNVVMADETMDLLKQRTLEIIAKSKQENRESLEKKELDELAEKIAVGAVKYALLRYSRDTTMQFSIDESLSLTGNSGPYLQYTYARTRSVLAKSEIRNPKFETNSKLEFNKEETDLLRTIYQFPEVILQATKEFTPNLICNYLFDLAQRFNLFYDKHRILTGDQLTVASDQKTLDSIKNANYRLPVTDYQSSFRLILSAATGQVIKNGLTILGIAIPERM